MGWFVKRPRLRVRKPFSSVRVGPVRLRKGGGSISAGPVGYSWTKKRKQR